MGGQVKSRTKPIPEGYHSITPYLSVQGAAEAIAFYKKAFGAREIMRMPGPRGKIGHAEIQIGDSRIMLADEFPEMNFRSPRSVGGTPVNIHLYVENVDKVTNKALASGAKALRPIRPVLWRSRRLLGRSLRPYLAYCDPYRGRTDEGVKEKGG